MVASPDVPTFDIVFAALAILESADQQKLAGLIGHQLSKEQVDLLKRHPGVHEENELFFIQPELVIEILQQFEQEDLSLYRELHERALAILETSLRAGETAIEKDYLAIFARLADGLIKDAPERFISLIESMFDLPLTTPVGIQLRSYYQGLKLRKEDRFEEAIVAFTDLLDKTDLDLRIWGRALNSRANCYRLVGKLESALDDYAASMKIWHQLDDKYYVGLVLLNMGIVAYELQNYGLAEQHFQESVKLFQITGATQWESSAYNELGLVYRDQGKWDAALEYFEKCRLARQAEGAQDVEGRRLNNVGEVLLFQGDLEKAQMVLKEALEKMTTRVYQVDAHLNQGLIFQASEKWDEALHSYEQAKTLALQIGRKNILPHVHYRMGDLLRRMNDDTGALAEYLAAVKAVEEERSPMRAEELKISLLGRWQQIYEALVLHYLYLGSVADAFGWAEHSRARAFAEILMSVSPDLPPNRGNPVDQDVDDLSVASIDEIQASLSDREAVCCYFTTGVLEKDVPLLRALPIDNPLREHLLTPSKTFLFFITNHGLACFDCDIDPNQFMTNSPRGHHYNQFFEPGVQQYLYLKLLGVVSDLQSYDHLYIIPHGPLHHVPFCLLSDRKTEIIQSSSEPYVTYAPSATILINYLLKSRAVSIDLASILAIGHRGGDRTTSLHYAELEASTVANLMGGRAWVGSHPKKEELCSVAVNQHLLHFACHGWFNQNEPLESYLETGTSERLTAREVIQNWQLNAALVVLSACQTGVSRILRSDEPMGLVRAFLHAGAQAVLVSQWAVEDFPTFLLIYQFYRGLQDHASANLGQLLHNAQRWLCNLTALDARKLKESLAADMTPFGHDFLETYAPDARPFAHPRHWAAFVLVGK